MGLQEKVDMIQRAIDNGAKLYVYADGERIEITPVSVDSAFNGDTAMMTYDTSQAENMSIRIQYADIRES